MFWKYLNTIGCSKKYFIVFVVAVCMYLYPPVIFLYLDYTVTANVTLLDSSVNLNELVVRRKKMVTKGEIKKKIENHKKSQ